MRELKDEGSAPPVLLLKTLWSESQGVGLMQYYVVSKVRRRLIIPDLL